MKGFSRPPLSILPENSIVPDENLITPPPNQFTHELTQREPFYYTGPQQGRPADGELPQDARVVLMIYDGGSYCRVVDERGLYVVIGYDSLRKL